MFRSLLATIIIALTALWLPAPAHGATPSPGATPSSSKRLGTSLARKINLRAGSANRKFPATGCSSRAATMPGSAGTLGPNGTSQSQTLVSVPVTGGTTATATASATQRAQLAEACAHVRH